jgi:hypothetical protein
MLNLFHTHAGVGLAVEDSPNSIRDASPILEIERYKDGTTALLLSFLHLLHSPGSDKYIFLCRISSNYLLATIAKTRRFSLISSHIAK